MATEKKYKCGICGKNIVDEESVIIGKKHFCKDTCEKIKLQEQKEGEDYRNLVQYLCNLTNVDTPNPIWLKTIKRLKEDSHYTSRGIMLTLKFFFEKLGNPVKDKTYIMEIVGHYYERAKNDYIIQMERRKLTTEFTKSGQELLTYETVMVKTKESENRFRQSKMIDMNQFVEEEEDEYNEKDTNTNTE